MTACPKCGSAELRAMTEHARRLERERDTAQAEIADRDKRIEGILKSFNRTVEEFNALKKATGYWASLQRWLDMVHEAYEGQDRDGLCQLYVRGPFAGWSQEKMVRLADELWENSQKYPFHPKEVAHRE